MLFSCQKETSTSKESSVFNPATAKEWYYAEFKKSTEWQGSSLKGNKLPDWKNGVIGKNGNAQVVEFPLVKKTKTFPVSLANKGKSLTESELKRVVNASLSKIAFFKNPSGNIVVREIDYVPDWDYLQKRGFNISDVSAFFDGNTFSGNIIVKQWDGQIISSLVLENGKIVKTGKRVVLDGQPTVNNLDCAYVDYCIWQQDCTLTIYGDGMMTNECGEWYNTGNCWLQEVCNGEIDPCLAYGNNCDPGGGNNEDEEYTRTGTSIKTVYSIDPTGGGGVCKVTQQLFARFYRNRPENDKITSCFFIRSDVNNNSLGATSLIQTYDVSNLHTNTVSVQTQGSIKYPDQSFIPFTNISNISLGDVAWHP